MQPHIDFFFNATPNAKAALIMESFKAKQVPVETLNYSYFIILNLKNTLKYFFHKNFFQLKNLIEN